MLGPDPKCPNCNALLTWKEHWEEGKGILYSWYCPDCGWNEDDIKKEPFRREDK